VAAISSIEFGTPTNYRRLGVSNRIISRSAKSVRSADPSAVIHLRLKCMLKTSGTPPDLPNEASVRNRIHAASANASVRLGEVLGH